MSVVFVVLGFPTAVLLGMLGAGLGARLCFAPRAAGWPTVQLTPVPVESVIAFWPALLRGLLTAAFGVVLLVWPHVSLHLPGVFAGLWLLFVGVAHIVGAFLRWRGLGWQVLSGGV